MNSTESTEPADRTAQSNRSDRFQLGHADVIAVKSVLWVIAAGSMLWGVVSPVTDAIRGAAVSMPLDAEATVASLDAVGARYSSGTFDVFIDHPSLGQRLLAAGAGLLAAAVSVWVVVLLVRLVDDIVAGHPFDAGNVRRLRSIGYLVMIGGSLVFLLGSVFDIALLSTIDIGDTPSNFEMTLPVIPIAIGGVILVIAQAFKVGLGLRDDVEGLI